MPGLVSTQVSAPLPFTGRRTAAGDPAASMPAGIDEPAATTDPAAMSAGAIDRGSVEHHRPVRDDALLFEQRAVHDAVVPDRHALAHVGGETRRSVDHRVVLDVGALADDHRGVVGADHHAVPDPTRSPR